MQPVLLRVQFTEETLRQFKARAALRGYALASYADMIFHYTLRERRASPARAAEVRVESAIYLLVEIPLATKMQLSRWKEKQPTTLAAFTGALINLFLHDFEKDPRDLAMIHYVSSLLEQKSVLSEEELRNAVTRCEHASAARYPPGHLAKWYYSRLKPLVGRIERKGKLVELTVEMFVAG